MFKADTNKTVVLKDSNRILDFDTVNIVLYERVDQKERVVYSKDICDARKRVMQQYSYEHGVGVSSMTGLGYRIGNNLIYYYLVCNESGYYICEIVSENNDVMSQLRHSIETIVIEEGHMLATIGEEKCRMLSNLCVALFENDIMDYQLVLEKMGFSSAELNHAKVIYESIEACYRIIEQMPISQRIDF